LCVANSHTQQKTHPFFVELDNSYTWFERFV
jgi:hypothetical protein